MQVINVTQGSPEWLALRAQHNTASEAPAMMGVSKYQTRSELLHQKSTGLTSQVNSHMQAIFDRGHSTEAAARMLVEEVLGEELFPVTALSDDGTLLASYDGLTMDDTTGYEHKLWNEALAAQVRAGELEPHYYWQLEQQILVGKLEKVIFVTSDGTQDKFESMEYFPVAGRAAQLVAGWAQFEADRAAYVPPAATTAVAAAPVQALPAVSVRVDGAITIVHNLDAFEVALRDFLQHRLIRSPKTDQDFADLDVQIKAMKGAEAALDSAEVNMLAQIQSVDTAKKTKDMLSALVRTNRLLSEKLLTSEKERRRTEIVTEGSAALREHIAALNTRLGKPYIPAISVDFAAAIKGMRSLSSMEDAVATKLANAKIETNATADRIQANLTTLRELAAAHAFLFADTSTIVLKACDDLTALVKTRISEHAVDEEKRLAAEREAIRVEEEAKATAKVLAEQAAAAAAQKVVDDAAAKAIADKKTADDEAALAAQHAAAAVTPISSPKESVVPDSPASSAIETIAPARNVVSIVRAPAVAPLALVTPPTLKLGQISERLGFNLTGDFLKTLGFEPAARDKSALLFHEASFPLICAALVAHIEQVQAKQAA